MIRNAVSPVRTISSSTPAGTFLRLPQQRSLLIGECQFGGVANRGLVRGGLNFSHERPKLFEDVVDGFPESCALADQAVAAAAGDAVDRSGEGEALAVLFHRMVAVESEPLRVASSTTTTPRQRPEMIRFRWENRPTWLSVAPGKLASSGPLASAPTRTCGP
jgi:hypothetical protein